MSALDDYLAQAEHELRREQEPVEDSELPSPTDLSGPPRPVRHAIPNLALRGQLTTLYACLGSGKTTIYQHAAVANEIGEKFLGLYDFEEPQIFTVFDWENGDELYKRVMRRLGVDPGSMKRTNVYCDLDPERFNLDTPEGRTRIRKVIERDGATCVIFDGRDTAFPHTGENEGDKIGPVMRAVLQLARELDVAVVFISQEPKAEYGDSVAKLRGHSAWGQYSEQMFRLIRHSKTRLLQHTKNRGIDLRPGIEITLFSEGETDVGPLRLEAKETDTIGDRMQKRAEDAALVEAYLDTNGDTGWTKLKQAMKDTHEMGDSRLRNAIQTSERAWQPGGERSPYSTTPKPDELDEVNEDERLALVLSELDASVIEDAS